MAYKISWSPTSRDDLKSIVTYIAEVDSQIAERFGLVIISKVDQLIEFPHSGRVVPEFGVEHIRELIHSPYRIVYRIRHQDKLIDIARIWHAAQGVPKF